MTRLGDDGGLRAEGEEGVERDAKVRSKQAQKKNEWAHRWRCACRREH